MSILGWATSSNQRALSNARAAAVECSRRRLERAEVAQFLEQLHGSRGEAAVSAAATAGDRGIGVRAAAR